jgi:hypothetical protein
MAVGFVVCFAPVLHQQKLRGFLAAHAGVALPRAPNTNTTLGSQTNSKSPTSTHIGGRGLPRTP